jgi:hypothetical protein
MNIPWVISSNRPFHGQKKEALFGKKPLTWPRDVSPPPQGASPPSLYTSTWLRSILSIFECYTTVVYIYRYLSIYIIYIHTIYIYTYRCSILNRYLFQNCSSLLECFFQISNDIYQYMALATYLDIQPQWNVIWFCIRVRACTCSHIYIYIEWSRYRYRWMASSVTWS